MMYNLYNKKNGSQVSVLYPKGGSSNILRKVEGVKTRSGTGPTGRFITVKESNGSHRSLSLSKCVMR